MIQHTLITSLENSIDVIIFLRSIFEEIDLAPYNFLNF